MSDLSNMQKAKLEKIFEMGSGYVLGFSNRTFAQFILEAVNKDIYEERYSLFGDSKANRLRAFWKLESNYLVAKLTLELLEQWKTNKILLEIDIEPKDYALYEECTKFLEALKNNGISEHIDDLMEPDLVDSDFSLLARTIRDSIEKNEPEVALDRLHTYVVKYIRSLCDKHGIIYDNNKPLHSFYGEYVKYLRKNSFIESEMTERILRNSISILDAFNDVRNNRSFAHDNKILNYHESMLIFKSISSTISFIESIELKMHSSNNNIEDWELPF